LTRAPGAEACIDARALSSAVELRLGRAVFTTDAPEVIIEAHVRPANTGWHAAIAIRGADGTSIGQRELEEPAPDCRALDDALVLVVALTIDPDAAMRAPPASPPPPRPPPPPPPPPAITAVAEPWRFGAAASLAVAGGLLPGAALGGAIGVTVDAPRVPPLELRGTLWRESERRDQDRGGAFGLATVAATVCPAVWRFALCGGAAVGRMTGTGFGFDRSQEAQAVVLAALVEPRLAVAVTPRVELTAGVGAWIPLVRPRFVFDQAGEPLPVYQPLRVAVIGQIGVAVHF
jgi:hypothetical protein